MRPAVPFWEIRHPLDLENFTHLRNNPSRVRSRMALSPEPLHIWLETCSLVLARVDDHSAP